MGIYPVSSSDSYLLLTTRLDSERWRGAGSDQKRQSQEWMFERREPPMPFTDPPSLFAFSPSGMPFTADTFYGDGAWHVWPAPGDPDDDDGPASKSKTS